MGRGRGGLRRRAARRIEEQAARLTRSARRERCGARADAYLGVFFTGQRRAASVDHHQAAGAGVSRLSTARLKAEKARLEALVARRRAVVCRDRTAALITLAREVIARYGAEKDRRGLLDYDDLIDKAGAMLDRVDSSWVHYKLDLGLDHMLIDEAQDTSEKQWRIVRQLVAEFAAGAGARGSAPPHLVRRRRREAVDLLVPGRRAAAVRGDAAPFRGAVLRERDRVAARAVRSFVPLRRRTCSARWTRCSRPPRSIAASPATRPACRAHLALPAAVPGVVEVWPMVEPEPKAEMEAWDAPFDAVPESSPRAKLAAKIAGTVRGWIADGTPVGDTAPPAHPRRRAHPRAPARPAVRGDHPRPEECRRRGRRRRPSRAHRAHRDHRPDGARRRAAAAAGRSRARDRAQEPAVRLRRRSPVRARLEPARQLARHARRTRRRTAGVRRRRRASRPLRADGARDDAVRVLRLAARRRSGGRRRIFARLGVEAADALEEFLELALAYERQEPPSLQGFLAWLRPTEAMVKRDMEIERDEVRVMTVHGAKGLEAPVVILADTTTPPAGPPGPAPLMAVPQSRAAPGTPPCIVWPGRKDDDVAAVAAARAGGAAGGRGRAPPAALCRDDARRRAADRLRLAGCQPAAGGLLVRPRHRRPRRERGLSRKSARATARIGRYRIVPHQRRCPRRGSRPSAARRTTFRLGSPCRSPSEPARTVTLTPSSGVRGIRCAAPSRLRRAGRPPRARARTAGAPAAAVAAGDCGEPTGARRRPDTSSGQGAPSRATSGAISWRRCSASWTMPALRRCSRPAAGPKCRSSAGSHVQAGRTSWCRARSTAWSSLRTPC